MREMRGYASVCSEGELLSGLGLSRVELAEGHSSADGTVL